MTSVSSSDQSFDIVSKVLVIGESSVGKTALIKRYIDDEYLANHTPTLGKETPNVKCFPCISK